MIESVQTSAIVTAGMKILRETLGLIETEIFIAYLKQDNFDYTEWRQSNLFENMTLEELISAAAEYEQKNPESIPKNAKYEKANCRASLL